MGCNVILFLNDFVYTLRGLWTLFFLKVLKNSYIIIRHLESEKERDSGYFRKVGDFDGCC